jgi:Leucine-rich repeat (LRR) protein
VDTEEPKRAIVRLGEMWPLICSALLLLALLALQGGGAVEVEVSPTGAAGAYGRHHARPAGGAGGAVPAALDRKLQKLALLELYAATAGPGWADSEAWTTGSDPCQWYGVRCTAAAGAEDGTLVTHLQLPANKLNGTIPDVFADLPHLRVLDLSLNYLKGPVPASVGGLPRVETLDLGYNYLLLSLKSLAGLRTLESLCLRWNTLVTGSLEDIAGSLTRLRDLDLRDNKMTSLTTAGLADMRSLRTVHLEKSGLHGALDLAAIRHLDTFIASGNRLEGVLRIGSGGGGAKRDDGAEDAPSSSPELFHRLVTLDLADNMLEGRIPRLPGAPLLTTVTVQNNNFEGSDFRLRDHPRLQHVDMSGNALLQPFPVDFFRATNLVKFLCANCGLTGVLALPNKGLSPNPNLEELVLFNNELFGVLPDALWNFPSLRVLDLSNNQFFGAISPNVGRLEHLEQLELASNRLSGALPDTMRRLFKLHTARLEHNAFSGALPTGIFDEMRALQVFAIHGNALDDIPDVFPAHVQTWPLGLRAPASAVVSAQKDPAMVVLYGNRLGAADGDAASAAATHKVVHVADDDAKVYRVCGTMNDFFHNTLVSAGWLRTEGAFYHASYGKCYGDSDDASARSLLSMQRASRFPYVGQLSDKGLLTHNIEAMRKLFPDEYSFYPRSFTIPAQLEEYKRSFDEVALTLQHPEKDNLWLMKPRARCCGEGIRIINKAEDAAALVDPNLGEWYTQRFVSPPALIDGHKFVFRLFAVVTR